MLKLEFHNNPIKNTMIRPKKSNKKIDKNLNFFPLEPINYHSTN